MTISRVDFERLVVEALDELPAQFLASFDNLEVIVEEEPSQRQRLEVGAQGLLLGLYEGVPRTARSSGYSMVVPDRITIFRQPILRLSQSETQTRELVKQTVIHEVAHHFGISDARLRELGVY